MKLGPLSKLEKKNAMMTLCTKYDIIINIQVYDQFRAMRELDFGWMIPYLYCFINDNLLSNN